MVPWLLGSMVAMGVGSDITGYVIGGRGRQSERRLLRQLGDGPLVFQGVDERQDSSLYAGGDPTGHRVTRG